MPKPVVLLVHGMGSHEPPDANTFGTFGSEFVEATNKALRRYPNHSDGDIQDHIEIVEFNYDHFFDKIRTKMAEEASVASRLDTVAQLANGTFAEGLVGNLLAWESRFADDEFFYTHWLDVIFYSTFIGGKIRVDLAKVINELIKDFGNKNIHIVAHSLGTSLVFDTLNLLYRPELDAKQEIPNLSAENDRIASVWMIANVSRLLNFVSGLGDPLSPATTVKPGDGGCTTRFYNVRHKLDPFTRPGRFDPENDGNWISTTAYKLRYRSIVNDLVIDPNTHSFSQYIEDPNVATTMLKLFLRSKFDPSDANLDAADEAYAEQSIQGAFNRLSHSLSGIEITDKGSIDEFLEAAKGLLEAIDSIKENL